MTNNEQRKRLRELYRDGVISEETYNVAIGKVPEEKKLDIFINHQGMLVIVYAYRQQKWTIRIPLAYKWVDFVKENYPMSVSRQGRNNRALLKVLSENRYMLNQLDIERKQKYLTPDMKSGVKSEPKGKSRVISVAQSGGW